MHTIPLWTEPMTSTDHAHSTVSVEQTLQPIPEDVRTHRVSGQFWIWCGANIAPINWVLGALGIALGLGLRDTLIVLVLGNLIGMAVFGLFVLMGQRTGVTGMVLVASGVRPARRLPAGGDPSLLGDRLVRGQYLDHPRPRHGVAGKDRSR